MSGREADVLVVGGGPAGLSAAIELRRRGIGCTVIEREPEPGGIPRHSDHLGFGVPDLHRLLTGPGYARRLADLADRAGTEILTCASVVAWPGERTVRTTSPSGVDDLGARAVVLATGCRERPRSARLIPGGRPAGVLSTWSLQQLARFGGLAGTRAVIVGAEHVSYSAALTLRQAGIGVAAMVTEHARTQTYPLVGLAATVFPGVTLVTATRLVEILGRERVAGVRVADATGAERVIECDTVVLTADWTPNGELARLRGLDIDAGTRGPAVDAGLRTSGPGIFAAGNVLHGAETADVASAEGRRVAAAVERWLADGGWAEGGIPVEVEAPLAWIFPNRLVAGDAGPGRFTLRSASILEGARVEVRQGRRALWRGYLRAGALASFLPGLPGSRLRRTTIPGRPAYLPATWVARIRADEGPVVVRPLVAGRRAGD